MDIILLIHKNYENLNMTQIKIRTTRVMKSENESKKKKSSNLSKTQMMKTLKRKQGNKKNKRIKEKKN